MLAALRSRQKEEGKVDQEVEAGLSSRDLLRSIEMLKVR
jgi:hypothetical protein